MTSRTLLPCLLLVTALGASAQTPLGSQGGKNRAVSAVDRKAIVDSVGALLERMYVFPDKGKKVAASLRANLKAGKYNTSDSLYHLTEVLTADMRALSGDFHLWIEPSDQPAVGQDENLTEAERQQKKFDYGKTANFGFREIKILDGNIGYLDLRNFFEAGIAAPTAIAAMNFLAHTRALIIDLRENGGGDPSMIQLITSYFFDNPVHLNSFYDRRTDSIVQFWTQGQVVGPRMSGTPVYVLTSQHSFSAAEEFVYNLKNLGRARLIGETTGGGAHPNELVYFPNLGVSVSVAWGRAINPLTGTNWEGVGVKPDIAVPAKKALSVAQMLILDTLISREQDSLSRRQMQWWRSSLAFDTSSFSIEPARLADYAGTYGPRKVWLENGSLWYQRGENPKSTLRPLDVDLFQHADNKYFRVSFKRDATGRVTEFVGLYAQGHQDRNVRSD